MVNNKLEYYVIAVALLINFLISFSSTSVSIAIPYMAADLGLSVVIQNWISNIFLLTVAVCSIPCAFLVSKYGIKRGMILGILISIISCIGCVFSFSAESLLFFRVVEGFGCAILNVSAVLFIVEPLPKDKRGKGLGISIAGVYLGVTIAPVVSGYLTYNMGWQSIFYFGIPFFILVLFILFFLIKRDWKINENSSFDLKGTLIFALGMILFIFGFTYLNRLFGVISAIVGFILLIYFVLYERKVKEPIFKVDLFKELEFSIAAFAFLISYIATYIITFVLNYHFQYIMGLTPGLAGLLLVVSPIFQVVISPFAGRLSDKVNPLKLVAFGLVFVVFALGILCTLNNLTPLRVIILAMVLYGIGWGLCSSPNVNAIMSSVPPKYSNYASSAESTFRSVGQALSLGLFTVIFAMVMGNVPIVPANYHLLIQSSQIACAFSLILAIFALIACIYGYKNGTILNSKESNNNF